MSDRYPLPVIFLAFANVSARPLPRLEEEYRQLTSVMTQVEQSRQCELALSPYATVDEVLSAFQNEQYRGRIAIFHYAGHGNGYELMLQDAQGQPSVAHAGGLAAFLSHQKGLRLVFLNACSTENQARALLDAGVAVVIATSQDIKDAVATDFAARFYQGLAGGDTIQEAFHEAQSAVTFKHGDVPRNLYAYGVSATGISSLPPGEIPSGYERRPWMMYPLDGGQAASWRLPPPAPPESFYSSLRWALLVLLIEFAFAAGSYTLYLLLSKYPPTAAAGRAALWLSLLTPIVFGLWLGRFAPLTRDLESYSYLGLVALGAGLLTSLGVALSLGLYHRFAPQANELAIDWQAVFYAYFLAPIILVTSGAFIGYRLKLSAAERPARKAES